MGKHILHRVGNGGHCGCETVSREVLPQVEIPEKCTQEPPCFAITIGVHTNKQRVLTPEHQGWNDLQSVCRIGMEYHLLNNDNDNNNNNDTI